MISAEKLIEKVREAYRDKWGYIWGTSGQLWTQQDQSQVKDENALLYGQKWVGHRVADCSGLISWAVCNLGGYVPHGSNSIYRKYCSETGEIKAVEMLPGMAVFKVRPGKKYSDGLDYYHIGLYVGNNEVIEAQGTRTGVVKTKLSTWSHYGRLKGVDYKHDTVITGGDTDMQGPAYVDVPNDGTVNVREKPSTSSKVYTKLREGTKVDILEDKDGWCKVNIYGYIKSEFLKEETGSV